MNAKPSAEIDRRFSDPDADPTTWSETLDALERAELYWISTVRSDGRPHVTPLIGVVEGEAVHFCTGLQEQKARNLEHSRRVALTTGNNAWARGLDVVVEGAAVQVEDRDELQRLADAYEAKYGSAWHFEVGDGVFQHEGGTGEALVFEVVPTKILSFAKETFAATRHKL